MTKALGLGCAKAQSALTTLRHQASDDLPTGPGSISTARSVPPQQLQLPVPGGR